jgi:RNA polymerase sigma-70 factor (ECF subfamily)
MAIYIDDRELVAAHRAGDNGAFDELVREHRDSLLAHAKRKLNCDASAEDALQETLVRAYKALPKFDGEYRLGPWMHRIMHNVCIDEAVRRRRDGEKTNNFAAQPIARNDAPSVEDELGMHFDGTDLNSALDDLSASHREALVLRFVDELNYDEVAQMSGVSEQNARARVSRARSAMRMAMKGVAALPVILFGLLRRGEKVAAAVTSTTGAATVSAHSVTAPALAEVTVAVAQAAPIAIPVIAKAAVGIGLIAAVFTPTTDSAVHQAVENLVTGPAGVIVEYQPDGEGSSVLISQAVVVSSNDSTLGYSPIETLSPQSSGLSEVNRAAAEPEKNDAAAIASASPGTVVLLRMDQLVISEAGGGRYEISGAVELSAGTVVRFGVLGESSWLRVAGEADRDGRQRLDALFVVGVDGFSSFAIQMAGFAIGESQELQVAGLFRADPNDSQIAEVGSFSGVISTGPIAGPVTLTLLP